VINKQKLYSRALVSTAMILMLASSTGAALVYITNAVSNTVSVIDTATNNVISTPVGTNPDRVAVTPDGTKVYVANAGSNNIYSINSATHILLKHKCL